MRLVTAIVILAAGASRRLGVAKQLEILGGETLLERAVRVAQEAGLGTVYVVADAADRAVTAEAECLGCEVVPNEDAEEGMASSIRAGVRAAGETAASVLIMTCDQPAVSAAHLRLLAAGPDGDVTASGYAGRRGVPACFPARVFGELLALRGDAGARDLLREACAIELEYGEIDIDTAEELERARGIFGRERA